GVGRDGGAVRAGALPRPDLYRDPGVRDGARARSRRRADDAGRGRPRLAAPQHGDPGFPDDHRDAVHVLHRQRHHARDRLVRARPCPHRARPRRPPPPLRPRRRAPPLLRDHRLLTMPTDRLTDLKNRLALVQDLRASAAVLEWDQETYMPPGAAEARAHQLATLKTLAHRRFTDES